MITLKELVDQQSWNELSDIQIIKEFFIRNDMEEDAIELIAGLSRSKVEKLKRKQEIVKEWACILPTTYLYKNYKLEIADKLHMIQLDYLVNGGELSNHYIEWARENFPNIKRPEAYFNPLIEYLERMGIEFKER